MSHSLIGVAGTMRTAHILPSRKAAITQRHRQPILSQIIVGEGLAPPVLKLLPFGECAREQIEKLEERYNNIKIDNYVIMPNHIHILMRIECRAGGASPSPTISDVICSFETFGNTLTKIQ